MLVDNNVYKNVYKGNGITTEFPISFPFLDNAHIQVVRSLTEGVEEVVPTSEYTISGAGVESGGTCVFNTAPATGTSIGIVRDVPITQLYAYRELDNFPAESHENALAKLTMICQQLSERLSRAITVSVTDDLTPEELRNKIFEMYGDIIIADKNVQTALANLFCSAITPFTTQDGVLEYEVGTDIPLDPILNNLFLVLDGEAQEPIQAFTIVDSSHIKFTSNPGNGKRCWGITSLSMSSPDIRVIVETAMAKVTAEGDKQVGRVTSEGNTQVGLVTSEGDKQVASITAEGTQWEGVARAWAESDTPPDPSDPNSKSAKSWALVASDNVPVMIGATSDKEGLSGKVPTPQAGKQNKPLRGDGTWADFLDCVVSAIKDGEIVIDAAKLKEMLAKYLPLTGGKVSGPIYQSLGALYAVITDAYKQVGLSCTEPGAGDFDGALLILNAGTSKYNPGGFNLRARTGVSGQDRELIGGKDGSLVWFNKHIVRSVNNVNADTNGNVNISLDASNAKLLTISGTYTATKTGPHLVIMVGGGGAGGRGLVASSGGGAGGGRIFTVSLNKGQSVSYTIGGGGAVGAAGGITTFNGVSVSGGSAGVNSGDDSANGGNILAVPGGYGGSGNNIYRNGGYSLILHPYGAGGKGKDSRGDPQAGTQGAILIIS
mgnify:CR=1 FL=1